MVLEDQIEQFNLPTRPTKKTDSRSKDFEGESVEVDAIPPRQLKSMVKECIGRHIDNRAYRKLLEIEAAERQTISNVADWYEKQSN